MVSKFKNVFTFIVIITSIFLSTHIFAQSPESLLKGLEFVEVKVYITWDDNIQNIDHESIEQGIQTICEQELRNNGITVSPEGFNQLAFHLITSYRGGIVAVSYTMDLYEYIIPRKHLMKLLEDAVGYAQIGSELSEDGSVMDSVQVMHSIQSQTLRNLLRMLSSEINYWWRPTWLSDLGVFTIGVDNLQTAMEDKTRELMHKFVEEYTTVNRND